MLCDWNSFVAFHAASGWGEVQATCTISSVVDFKFKVCKICLEPRLSWELSSTWKPSRQHWVTSSESADSRRAKWGLRFNAVWGFWEVPIASCYKALQQDWRYKHETDETRVSIVIMHCMLQARHQRMHTTPWFPILSSHSRSCWKAQAHFFVRSGPHRVREVWNESSQLLKNDSLTWLSFHPQGPVMEIGLNTIKFRAKYKWETWICLCVATLNGASPFLHFPVCLCFVLCTHCVINWQTSLEQF